MAVTIHVVNLMREKQILYLLNHKKSAHNIKYKGKVIKHLNLKLDIYDSNQYCQFCEKAFLSLTRCREHLRHTHYMAMKTLKLPKKKK
jgi:hypothetical protein